MTLLMKQYFRINGLLFYLTILILFAILYLIKMSSTFTFLLIFFTLFNALYLYDDKNKVNLFMASLPVSKKRIIQSRYLFFTCAACLLLLLQWSTIAVFSRMFSENYYIYDWRSLIILLCIALMFLAVCLPIYYRFPYTTAVGIILALIGMLITPLVFIITKELAIENTFFFNDLDLGFILITEKYIPFAPYLLLMIGTLISIYISMKISEHLFISRDL